jgi:hypothetical protein
LYRQRCDGNLGHFSKHRNHSYDGYHGQFIEYGKQLHRN